jgi:hypothetical protein
MVAGYVFFVQLKQTPEAKEEPPWFYNVDMSDMSRIAISAQGEEAVFSLGGDDHWHLGKSEGLPVSLERWGGITLLLSGPKSSRLLDEQPTDLEPYGLDLPPTSIEVKLKDGRTHRVLLGFPTPDGEGTYSQVEGFPQVYTIFGGWREVLTRLITEPPYPEWYYNLDQAVVTAIELRTQEKIVVAMTKVDAGWRFNNEAQSPVDEAQLPPLFAALEKPAQTVVAYNAENLAQYGLDKPSLSLFLETQRREEDGITVISQTLFHIGNPNEDGKGYYAQTQRGEVLLPDVFMVNADWVNGLQAIVANPPHPGDVAQGG